MSAASTDLQDLEVALAGRFASMSQTEVAKLIRDFGGCVVRIPTPRTRFVVVGQGGLALDLDGKPTSSLEKARSLKGQGCDIEVITEEVLFTRLGLGGGCDGIHRRLTIVELARILNLPGERVRSWIRSKLIEPVEVVNRVALFDFRQVAAARTLCQLIEAGLPPTDIRRGLEQLRRLLPESELPLLRVSAIESTSRVLARLNDGTLVESSGQLQFDFDETGDADETSLAFVAVARTADELFDDAVALELAGRFTEAEGTYRQILKGDCQDPISHFNLGNVLIRLGRLPEAMDEFLSAVRIDPSYVEAWNNLGTMLFESAQLEEAASAFLRALKLVPNYADACFNLATTYTQLGRNVDACRHWQLYLDLDPNSPSAEVARKNLSLCTNRQQQLTASHA